MPWNEMLTQINAVQELHEDNEPATDCEAQLSVELANTLARAYAILRALAADEAAREAVKGVE